MPTPCNPNVTKAGDLTSAEADQLLLRAKRLAEQRVLKTGQPVADALREIAGEMIAEEKTMSKIRERNMLMSVRAKQNVKDYATRFKTMGQGVLAFLQGSVRNVKGARLSVDYQAKAVHGKYFGSLVARMEDAGVLSDFKHPSEELKLDIYREMGAMAPGEPAKAVTKNPAAFEIAKIIDSTWAEMVARQNRAGAYIKRVPGYVARQTHDQAAIRALGGVGNNQGTKSQSFAEWDAFTRPLLDPEKTMMGEDPDKFMRNIHEALYSGIHGPPRDEMDVQGVTVMGSLAKKQSETRVLHFRDAESAYQYNQAFGIKDLKEQVLHDVHVRARSIAMMENLGPTPQATLGQIVRELQEEARTREDAAVQVDSLRDWRIDAAFKEITGINEMSANPSLSNITGTVKVLAQMAKMGGVALSSFTDKAFLQSEMAFQGISNLQTLGAQITGMARRSKESKQMLRMMGVAMDGLIGNALSRYSNHSSVSGWGHTAQKWFFDLNLLNAWTDANKATAAELMAAHLGEHAHLPMSLGDLPGTSYVTEGGRQFAVVNGHRNEVLPADLSKVLALYGITPLRWDALRSTAVDARGTKVLLPDQVSQIPSHMGGELLYDIKGPHNSYSATGKLIISKDVNSDNWRITKFENGIPKMHMDATKEEAQAFLKNGKMDEASKNYLFYDEFQDGAETSFTTSKNPISIQQLVEESGSRPTPANILRERDALETALRTYYTDRADIAVPTPGAAERKYATWGTQAGTPLGEALRMMMLFKSFPITVLRKIIGRNIYGNGATSMMDWLLHDHRGKFNLATLIAMATAAGYVSGAIKDALKGRTPKPLVDDQGNVILANLNDAALRGGALGILGDVLMSEYSDNFGSVTERAAGPIVGQLDQLGQLKTALFRGKNIAQPAEKLLLDNAPLINLFYIRPVLDYFVLWNLQEMMSPGSLGRMESAVERRNHQTFYVRPSEVVRER